MHGNKFSGLTGFYREPLIAMLVKQGFVIILTVAANALTNDNTGEVVSDNLSFLRKITRQ